VLARQRAAAERARGRLGQGHLGVATLLVELDFAALAVGRPARDAAPAAWRAAAPGVADDDGGGGDDAGLSPRAARCRRCAYCLTRQRRWRHTHMPYNHGV
jgi:hypothetical protein